MKKILYLALILSISVHADECSRPGTLLSHEYQGIQGESASSSYSRTGDSSIPSTASFKGNISTRLNKIFRDTYCVQKSQNYSERVCNDISMDLALGRGNEKFKKLFDLRVTVLKRAEYFEKIVSYGQGQPASVRFNLANEIVLHLTRLAAVDGIPSTWKQVHGMLSTILAEGYITQADFDDIMITNGVRNRHNLGFTPLEGSQVIEARGNGKLQKIFALDMSPRVRGQMVNDLLVGVAAKDANALGQSFVEFAISNGIPNSWDQFELMMVNAVNNKVINQKEFDKIVVTYEEQNRRNMGYTQSAVLCKNEIRTRYYNVIEARRSAEFYQNVNKNFEIEASDAPLLAGEEERFTVSFDGQNPVDVSVSSSYNSFKVLERSMNGDIEVIKLQGSRKQITPDFTLIGSIMSSKTETKITLQNTGFDPKVGGKVIVKVEFMEKVPLWFDKSIGSATYELTDGDSKQFTSSVRSSKGRKVYAKVSMQVVGSSYYNSSVVGPREIK